MPKLKEQADPEFLAEIARQGALNRPRFVRDVVAPHIYPENTVAPPEVLETMSAQLTSLIGASLNSGSVIRVHDGSHTVTYALAPVFTNKTDTVRRTGVQVERKAGFNPKEHFLLLNASCVARFQEVNGRTGLSLVIGEGDNELTIPSDGPTRPNPFTIIAEREVREDNQLIKVEHAVLAGKRNSSQAPAPIRDSLSFTHSYSGDTAWVIAGVEDIPPSE